MRRGSKRVKVYVRFRPENDGERNWARGRGSNEISGFSVKISSEKKKVHVRTMNDVIQKREYQADRIFDYTTTQEEMFDTCAKPLIEDLLTGFNSTFVFVGPQGCGKSFSFTGYQEHIGIAQRSINMIFDHINTSTEKTCEVKVQYFEVKNEKIKDLVDPRNENLKIRKSPRTGVYIESLSNHRVTSLNEFNDVLHAGDCNISRKHLQMALRTKISHSVLSVILTQEDRTNGSIIHSKLNFVVLASNSKEYPANSRTTSSLFNCIEAIKLKKKRIPYRDSCLTNLLQQSLGGTSRCCVIVNSSQHAKGKDKLIDVLNLTQRICPKVVKRKRKKK